MLVIDDVDAFVGDAHSRPDFGDDATLSRLRVPFFATTAPRCARGCAGPCIERPRA
jgi:hypothetical protein